MAALVLYRALELLSQHLLFTRFGIDAENVNYSKLEANEARLKQKVNDFLQRHHEGSWRELPIKFGLLQGYYFLGALNVPEISGVNYSELKNVLYIRNHGLFAHGFRKLSLEEFERFQKIALDVLRRAWSKREDKNNKGSSFEKYCSAFEFVTLKR